MSREAELEIQLSGVYESLSDHRTAGFCNDHNILCSGRKNGGEQVSEALSVQFQKSW